MCKAAAELSNKAASHGVSHKVPRSEFCLRTVHTLEPSRSRWSRKTPGRLSVGSWLVNPWPVGVLQGPLAGGAMRDARCEMRGARCEMNIMKVWASRFVSSCQQ